VENSLFLKSHEEPEKTLRIKFRDFLLLKQRMLVVNTRLLAGKSLKPLEPELNFRCNLKTSRFKLQELKDLISIQAFI
jgi:hypothetical protein